MLALDEFPSPSGLAKHGKKSVQTRRWSSDISRNVEFSSLLMNLMMTKSTSKALRSTLLENDYTDEDPFLDSEEDLESENDD